MLNADQLPDELSALDDIEIRSVAEPDSITEKEREAIHAATAKEAAILISSCGMKNEGTLCEDILEGNPCAGCIYASDIVRIRNGTPDAIRNAVIKG